MTNKSCKNCYRHCIMKNCENWLPDNLCPMWESTFEFTIIPKEQIMTDETLTFRKFNDIGFAFQREHPEYNVFFDGDSYSMKARLM